VIDYRLVMIDCCGPVCVDVGGGPSSVARGSGSRESKQSQFARGLPPAPGNPKHESRNTKQEENQASEVYPEFQTNPISALLTQKRVFHGMQNKTPHVQPGQRGTKCKTKPIGPRLGTSQASGKWRVASEDKNAKQSQFLRFWAVNGDLMVCETRQIRLNRTEGRCCLNWAGRCGSLAGPLEV